MPTRWTDGSMSATVRSWSRVGLPDVPGGDPVEPGQLIRRLAIFPSRSSKLIGPVPLKPSPETVSVTV
jgi:hypothetical protein